MFTDFKKFIMRGNVVDLAVGIVIGAAFTGFVNAFVKDIINPIVELFYRGDQFSKVYLTIHGSQFHYGDLLNNLLSFLLVALVVFFFVVQPINKLSEYRFGSKVSDLPSTRKCPYCLEVIPTKATRCRFCTSKLEAEDS